MCVYCTQMKILNGAFEFVGEDQKVVKCVRCLKQFKFHRSTSSLSYHLRKRHPEFTYQSEENSNSSSIRTPSQPNHGLSQVVNYQPLLDLKTEFSGRQTQDDFQDLSGSFKNSRPIDIATAIATWLVKDLRPVDIANDKGLHQLLTAAAGYTISTLPTANQVKRIITDMYTRTQKKVKTRISEQKSIALTCESWSTPLNNNYLSVTAHHIGSDLLRRDFVLKVTHSNEQHTAQHVVKLISAVTEEWRTFVSALVMDESLIMMTTESAKTKPLPFANISCAAHLLHDSVSKGSHFTT